MNCKEAQILMFDCVEGALQPGMKDMFEAHIRECGSCTRLMESVQRLEEAIAEEKAVEPGPFVATRILQHIENNRVRRHSPATIMLRTIPVGLAIFLALAMGYFIASLGISHQSPAVSEDLPTEVIKTDLFIHDFVDEDLTLLTNY